MKKLVATLSLLISVVTLSFGQYYNEVKVSGYYKSNGTYVESHRRTSPNVTINDNWSTYPNVNPYTGTTGTVRPSGNTYSSLSTYSNTNSTLFTKPTRVRLSSGY